MKIRDALRRLRNELNISQSDLANMLNVTNITVNRWENGKSIPNKSAAMMLLQIATEKCVSNACQEMLQEALFPTAKEEGLDDLRFAEIAQINQLLNDSSNAVVVCDKETHEILYMNHKTAAITEQTMEEASGKKCYEYLLKRECPCRTCEKVHASRTEFTYFNYVSPTTGRHYMMQGKTISWKGREALIEYITDVTELQCAKTELAEKKAREKQANRMFTELLDNVSAGIALYKYVPGRELMLEYVNDGLCKQYGMSRAEILSEYEHNHMVGVAPEYRDSVKKAYEKLLETGKVQSVVYKTMLVNGRSSWLLTKLSAVKHEDQSIHIYSTFLDFNEEMEIQEKLHRSEEISSAAVSFANMFVFTYDIEKSEAYISGRLVTEFGFPTVVSNFPEAILEADYILPQYHSVYADAFRKIKAGNSKVEFEIQTYFPDRSIHWMRFRVVPMHSKKARPNFAVISAQTIDVEKAQEARIIMERRKMLAGDAALLGYSVADLNQEIIIEHSFTGIKDPVDQNGATMAQTLQNALSMFVDEEAKARFCKRHDPQFLIEEYKNGKTTDSMEYQAYMPDGRICWVNSVQNILRDPVSGDYFLYEYSYDIHDRKIHEELLTGAMQHDYEHVGVAFLANNQITDFEYTDEKEAGKIHIENYDKLCLNLTRTMVIPEERKMYLENMSIENIRKQLADKDGFEFIYRSINEEGELRYKRVRISTHDRTKETCLITRADVTDVISEEQNKQKKLKEALELAKQASFAKTDFLARMSHDLRTPMNAIIGLTALTLDDASDPERVRENMTKMRSASDYMLGLVNDILDMSKIEEGSMTLHLEPFSYQEFLVNMKTMFAVQCANKNIELHFQEPKLNPVVLTDKQRITQIVFNILSNALKYTPEGGHISYSVENLEVKGNILSATMVVEDDGIGMSEAFQEHLFEPFTQESSQITTQLQGSGLGLSITKMLVELMDGTIEVLSRQGEGTTVKIHLSFTLAQDESEKGQKKEKKTKDYRALSGKHILLIEDHPLNATIARRLLEKQGMIVVHGENGQIGLNMFAVSEEGQFDAILMDIRMPVMSGLEATRAIRALERKDAQKVPIIAMSANAYAEDVEKSKEAGMNAHLSKPVEPAKLYDTLVKCLCFKEE